MGSLDSLVAEIQALSGPEDLNGLHTQLKSPQKDNVMRSNAAHLLTVVANLDAAVHSLGCLYLLCAGGMAG